MLNIFFFFVKRDLLSNVLMTDFNEPTDALDYNKALECTFTGNNVFDHYKIE